jgi:hypothetical protein
MKKGLTKKVGLTMIEALIGLSVFGATSTLIINEKIKNTEKEKAQNIVHDSMSLLMAVDHKLAIEGYKGSIWKKTTWNNLDSIYKDLILAELTSKDNSICDNGGWNPTGLTDTDIQLIPCDTFKNVKYSDLDFKSWINKDSNGFVEDFELRISFKNEDAFKDYYQNLKFGLVNYKEGKTNISGEHTYGLKSLSSNNEINSMECIANQSDCSLFFNFNRNGGNEFIRVDGNNSIINDSLSFIDTAGSSPKKCLRWVNSQRDGSGNWSLDLNNKVDCGIGIYEGNPVMVDLAIEDGTFQSVLLDKNCNSLKLDSSNKVTNDGNTPCGIVKNENGIETEVIQVVDNTITNVGILNEMYVNKGYIKKAEIEELTTISIEDIETLTTETINAEVVKVMDTLTVNGESTFNDLARFKEEVEFNQYFDVKKSINVEGDINVDGGLISKSPLDLNDVIIDGTLTVNKKTTFESNSKVEENYEVKKELSVNGSVSALDIISSNGKATSDTKMKAPVGDFDNINTEIKNINKIIAGMIYVIDEEEGDLNTAQWVNSGSSYGCSSWSPSTSTVPQGQTFTQSRTCKQNQVKTTQDYYIWSDGTKTPVPGTEITEHRTITVTSTRTATGTQQVSGNWRKVYQNYGSMKYGCTGSWLSGSCSPIGATRTIWVSAGQSSGVPVCQEARFECQ